MTALLLNLLLLLPLGAPIISLDHEFDPGGYVQIFVTAIQGKVYVCEPIESWCATSTNVDTQVCKSREMQR